MVRVQGTTSLWHMHDHRAVSITASDEAANTAHETSSGTYLCTESGQQKAATPDLLWTVPLCCCTDTVSHAEGGKGEPAGQEAKFRGFYTWQPSDDATFFPVRSSSANLFNDWNLWSALRPNHVVCSCQI